MYFFYGVKEGKLWKGKNDENKKKGVGGYWVGG